MKKIPLTQGKFALVDDEDFKLLNQMSWHYTNNRAFNSKKESMSRVIIEKYLLMNLNEYERVDHINRNPLDNRKNNLRICSNQQNTFNSKSRQGTSSFKGVSWDKRSGKWKASISLNNQQVCCTALFRNENIAAHTYDYWALQYFKIFAYLNFPNFDYSEYKIIFERSKGKSGFYGVSYHKHSKRWICVIKKNNKYILRKHYKTKEEAAKEYDEFVVKNKLDPRKYPLNFPEDY